MKWIVAKEPAEVVQQSSVLVNFIYDEVVAKRKEAIRNMAELCWKSTATVSEERYSIT